MTAPAVVTSETTAPAGEDHAGPARTELQQITTLALSPAEVAARAFRSAEPGDVPDAEYWAVLFTGAPGIATELWLPLVDGRPADRLELGAESWQRQASAADPTVYVRPVPPLAFAGHPGRRG